MDQAPPVPFEANKNDGQGKKAEDLQGIGKDQGKKKTSSNPKEKAPNATASQPAQTVDPLAPKMKA